MSYETTIPTYRPTDNQNSKDKSLGIVHFDIHQRDAP
jgi:hypothetical protein